MIDVYSKLQPDPNDQSVALLRAILFTLNNSAIPDESPVVPPAQQVPPSEIVVVTGLLYASLLISLLAAFVAMLGKQWLNRYRQHAGGSMIERCGDRQRKYDGIQKWPFRFFIESLPLMLQAALLLLACGLCRYMASINTSVAYTLVALTALGVLFYIVIVIAGTSSYECPFQTPASSLLRGMWMEIGPRLIPIIRPVVSTLHTLGGPVRGYITTIHLSLTNARHYFLVLLRGMQLRNHHVLFYHPRAEPNARHLFHHAPLPMTQEILLLPVPSKTLPWFAPNEMAMIEKKNTYDIWCVSWVLKNITDPEVLDTAIRLAGVTRWFEDKVDAKHLYDLIISTFRACFGSNGDLYPELRDRAYYSGRAILWIHVLAMCESGEFGSTFHLPTTRYAVPASDRDLAHIIDIFTEADSYSRFSALLITGKGHTVQHSQWVSNIVLHLSWAIPTSPDFSSMGVEVYVQDINPSVPLDAIFNRLLMCCNFLGSPIEEEVLKIQDKSYGIFDFPPFKLLMSLFVSDRLMQVLDQVSRAIHSALRIAHPRQELIYGVLYNLARLDNRPLQLAEMAYGWCAAIWESRYNCEDWERLLLLSLEVGFRHIDAPLSWTFITLNHTQYHKELVDAVLRSGQSEPITDLLCASFIVDSSRRLALGICVQYIVDLPSGAAGPFSPRLRGLFSSCVEAIGFGALEGMGRGVFVQVLNRLQICDKEVWNLSLWTAILLEVVQSPEGVRNLAIQSWELLTELTTRRTWENATYSPQVTVTLLEAQEWEKLECWMGIVWMTWASELGDVTEDFRYAMISLFRQRPGAVRQLTRWMERWSENHQRDVPRSFYEICRQGREEAP